ncbi:adenylyl cyclase [Heterostelium album PN500]|uniref:Adenylyl cyclase n=1 Tax=Heterostelium pallidum (strain ATCC 26659 / Pp 5 / PN500) TaxID=670386 RepID=D3BRN1_HETP5|nr:adenylyl cyclase [Heterostelium album PN500]EFA76063.1 adenylyl cyclase [Heterostelium album PN500]|eukprot:XP_020428197.1 adenylyl cyclase [Heterostelium album PN500]
MENQFNKRSGGGAESGAGESGENLVGATSTNSNNNYNNNITNNSNINININSMRYRKNNLNINKSNVNNNNLNINNNSNNSIDNNNNSNVFNNLNSPRAVSARKYLLHHALDSDQSNHHYDNIDGLDDEIEQSTSIPFFNVGNISQSVHKLIRRDFFTVYMAFGGFWNALYYRDSYLQPYYITPFNFLFSVFFYLFILFPRAPSNNPRSTRPAIFQRLFFDDEELDANINNNNHNNNHHHYNNENVEQQQHHQQQHQHQQQQQHHQQQQQHQQQHHQHQHHHHKHQRSNSSNSKRNGNGNEHNSNNNNGNGNGNNGSKLNMLYWNICQFALVLVVVIMLFIAILLITVMTTSTDLKVSGGAKQGSIIDLAWTTVESIMYNSPNQIFSINESIVRLILILFLSGMTMLYHLQIRKTYTLLSLASLMPQVAEALYLLEYSMASGASEKDRDFVGDPYGGELNQQSDYMNRIYATGTQQLLEKFDFMQQFVEKMTHSIMDISKETCHLQSTDLNKYQIRSINTIQELINQNINLVDDIKLILAIESGDISVEDVTFNIFSLIEEVFEKISKDINNTNIELVFRVNEDVPLNLIGDPSALIQILLQLLKNSVKYTEKGDIGVIVSKIDPPVQSDAALLDQDDVYIEISVFDSGTGLTDDQLKIINQFQPFPKFGDYEDSDDDYQSGSSSFKGGYKISHDRYRSRSRSRSRKSKSKHKKNNNNNNNNSSSEEDKDAYQKQNTGQRMEVEDNVIDEDDDDDDDDQEDEMPNSQGTGLGLYICNKIIKGLGGSFVAQKNGDGGCVFVINLVFQVDRSPTPVSENPFALTGDQLAIFNQLPILIIDDDANVRMSTEMILKRLGLKPLTPTNLVRGISQVFNVAMSVHRKKFNSVFPIKVLESGRGRPLMRTLIGESDFSTQNIIQNCLETFRYHFTFVQDGATLLSMAKKNYYDLILVNIDLPVLNGMEVSDAIRKHELQIQSTASPDPVSTTCDENKSSPLSIGSTGSASSPSKSSSSSAVKGRRMSFPQLFQTSDLVISHKRKGSLKIIGISNTAITLDQMNIYRMSGMDDCIMKQDISIQLTNVLIEMDKQRKQMVYSPQKLLTPLTEKKEDMIVIPQLSTSRVSMMSASNSTPSSSTSSAASSNLIGRSTNSEIGMGLTTTTTTTKSTKRVQDLQNVISRFVPIEFQQLIAPAGMEHVYLGDAISKTITIFFSDIRDFTSTTEKMVVDDVIDFLNTYLAFAIPAITDKGGFIDKFIGDAIMAIFPHSDIQEQAIAAVKAAIGMMRSLDFMSESGFRFKSVETGIGINTGKTIIGIVGTETRMEPTALGDAVNLASRTEPLCKEYGSRILVTQFTIEAIGASIDEFTIRLVDSVKVKGKSEAVDIYEVIDGERDDIRALKLSILASFNNGVEHFRKQNYEDALSCFQNCNELFPADKPTKIFIQRCIDSLESEMDQID